MSATDLLRNLPKLEAIVDPTPLTVPADLPVVEVIARMSQAQGRNCVLTVVGAATPQLTPLPTALVNSTAHSNVFHSAALVLENDRLVGIFTERDVVEMTAQQRLLPGIKIAAVMTTTLQTLVLAADQTIVTALILLQRHQIRHLPILDDGHQLIGIVTLDRIRQVLQPINLLKFRTVAEGMNSQVQQATPSTTVLQIVQQMARYQVSSIVIMAEQGTGQPVGIITEQDIVQFQVLELPLAKLPAQEVMSSPLFCLQLDDSLWSAQQIMQAKNIRRLVVTDEQGILQGIVSQSNLLQFLDPVEMLCILEKLQVQLVDRATDLEESNRELRLEVIRRRQVEDELEQRVVLRTAELALRTQQLQAEIGDRQEAAAALYQSEQKFRAIFDGTFQFVGLLDTAGILLEANRTALQAIGVTAETVIGQPFWQTPWWTHSPVLQEQLQTAITQAAAGQLVRFEAQHFLADGSYVTVDFSLSPITDQTGQVVMLIPEGRDISDRKQAELSLLASEARFRAVLNAVPVGIFQADIQGNCIFVNQQCIEQMGVLDSAALGRGWTEALHPDDRERVFQEWYGSVQSDRREFQAEYRFLTPTGQVNWVSSSAIAIHDETGAISGYLGTVMNINDRKASEQKVQEQAALLDIATDAIIVRDLASQIQFWNQGAENIYGWSAAEAIGQTTTTLFYADRPIDEAVSIALQTLLSKGSWQGELQKNTKAGGQVLIESRWTLVRDEAGQPRSILSVDTDVTEKTLLERQFLRAQRLESLGTLASGIAHDLNNVLTPIVGAAQLLPHTIPNLDERNQRLLKMMMDSAKRGSALVKQILTFARGLDGQRSAVQVRHILAEIVSVARQTFPKSIEIVLDIHSTELWLVQVDPTQIHQVLMNLFVNARDALPQGGVITATAANVVISETNTAQHLQAQIGSYVMITVTDNGIGISREVLDRIFEPFFTTKEVGTGLGLSTVLGIVKAHGGFINVESTINQGSCFQIYLPAIAIDEAEQDHEKTTLADGRGRLVLVVDDELAVRQITKESLEAYNYRVLLANDGVEAIAKYVQDYADIAVVLIDMMMPHLDTPATMRALQRINPNVQMIVMSGLAANQATIDGQGAQAFLTKPFTTADLLQVLEEVINK